MRARWVETREPLIYRLQSGDKVGYQVVPFQDTVDIPSGESSIRGIAVRLRGEDNCYGWNDESFVHDWKHPLWKLEKGRYYARVRVRTGGREFVNSFLIVNDVGFEDFRIEATDADIKTKLM
ncbi:MAG: hypothetical protein ABIN58_07665 [candidate division WOR-3 bacterium]